LDFGYPQNSDIDALKMYITTESIKSERAVVQFSQLDDVNLIERGFIEDYYTSDRRNVISKK